MNQAGYQNVHGRRETRGLRPWLLIPKVLAAGLGFGFLTAASAMWYVVTSPAITRGDPMAGHWLKLNSMIFPVLIVPTLLTAIGLGILLFLLHPGVFIRMRWFQVKVVSMAIGLPFGHFTVGSRFELLRHAYDHGEPTAALQQQIHWLLPITVALLAWLIVLARLKPRLGQNWARDYASVRAVQKV